MTAVVFGVVALILTGPVPDLLSRARWPLHAPRAALVLWQSIALAAVLSAFSCGLAVAQNLIVLGPDGRPLADPFDEIAHLGWFAWSVYAGVFLLTLLIGARLMFTAVRVGVRTRSRRNAHRQMIDLLAQLDRPDEGGPLCADDVRMIAVDTPMAYCLPGLRSRLVISDGVVARLSHDELCAVVAHERSHLRARHDLVLEAFVAVHEAFPRFVRSTSALGAVELLVELLADDQAVRAVGPTPLGRALVHCAGATAPSGALAVGGRTAVTRVQRLAETEVSPLPGVLAYLAAGAILVIPTLAVAIPWLTELGRLLT
ncbi:M56 family metallopeptidase [Williamsia sterculiae]|uniref:Zn-dependent protease with chaperone function n=1 Tax=Williamsia sterculiae TaxID=1344003 RepID=A0A1N7H2N4_9NOCA|nr:M56 family metallopeptidase [Williamsia sterculiae]SIS19107.1 Zn-dependent protease with chaperone function [Williamsia sterculiae]